jgi:fatty-acyl-CoA synthase
VLAITELCVRDSCHRRPSVLTVPGEIARNAFRAPQREALVSADQRLTWSELYATTNQVAHALRDLGLAPGDRCALIAPNSGAFLTAAYGAMTAGAILVPINSRLAPREVAYILNHSGSTLLLFDPSLASTVQALAADSLLDEEVHMLALTGASGQPSLLSLSAECSAEAPSPVVRETDDAVILYTSGTTGFPKGVLHDHHRLAWAGMSQLPTCGFREAERYLHVTPLYHGGGIVMAAATVMVTGTSVVLGGFDPADVLETMERERITAMLGVPTMYQFLCRHPDLPHRDLSSWRVGIFGAAPMPATAVEAMLLALPNVELLQQCGQTEAGPNGIYQTPQQVRDRPEVSGYQAMPFLDCRVVAPDGSDTVPGNIGELLFRGESVMKGYWQDPAATAEVLDDAGWLHTGDLVRLDPDGAMTVIDRMRDVIITGGRNVYSVEVENAVASHPAVSDAAVIGRSNPDWGESIVAIVTLRPEADVDLPSLREHCRGLIADYKLPHELVLGEVPRNATGKILKHVLRDQLGMMTSG